MSIQFFQKDSCFQFGFAALDVEVGTKKPYVFGAPYQLMMARFVFYRLNRGLNVTSNHGMAFVLIEFTMLFIGSVELFCLSRSGKSDIIWMFD